MGFFGGTKTYYTSSSVPLFEEVLGIIPQTVRAAVAQNRNISEDLLTNLVNGIGFKAQGLYNYGKTGQLPWGLPDGSISKVAPDFPDKIQRIIEREIDAYIELMFSNITVDPITNHILYGAEYRIKDKLGNLGSTLHTWVYDERTGVYPDLIVDIDDVANVSPYYPIIPIRVDNVSQVDDAAPYKNEVRKACKYLGVKAEDLNEAIEEQANETGNATEDAYIVLGVEVTNDTQAGKRYLYDYFAHMLGIATAHKSDYEYWVANGERTYKETDEYGFQTEVDYYPAPPPVNLVSLDDSHYKMELGWLYITTDLVTGSIGKVGEYATSYTAGGQVYFGKDNSSHFDTSIFHIRKQVAANQYHELHVHGLTHSNWAFSPDGLEEDLQTGWWNFSRGKEIRTTLEGAFNEPNEAGQSLFVPLRRDIIKGMGPVLIHDLMYSSIRMIVNDVLRVKTKWYQSTFFQVFTLIIALALSFFDSGLTLTLWAATVLPGMIAVMILTRILLPLVIKELSDIVGQELALIVALIASYMIGDFTGVSAFNNVANTTLAAVNGATSIYFNDALKDIQQELELLQDETEELLEAEAEVQRDVRKTQSMISGDTYRTMEPTNYVKRFNYLHKLPTMITDTTEHFAAIMQFTDRPASYIKLGH